MIIWPSDPDHWLFFDRFFSMIDHFKNSKNSIDRLIKIEKLIDRSIDLKKSINRSRNIYQVQAIKQFKKNRTSFFYLLFIVTGHSLIFYCYSVTVTSRTVKTIEKNWKKIEKNRKKSIIWSFQNLVIENRWSKFHDRKKKSIVFLLINRKRSIIDFWSESLIWPPI